MIREAEQAPQNANAAIRLVNFIVKCDIILPYGAIGSYLYLGRLLILVTDKVKQYSYSLLLKMFDYSLGNILIIFKYISFWNC